MLSLRIMKFSAPVITKSIVESCDVFYYDLAFQLGIDHMHQFMSQFGFGQRSGIDILGERSGLMPSREWKKRVHNQVWFPGETVIAGIGQGYVLVTPLQLALATATMANGGKLYQPQLVHSIKRKSDPVPRLVSPQLVHKIKVNQKSNWDRIFHAMTEVIHGRRGTARRLNKPGMRYKIAGKTGTAQVFSVAQDASYKEEELEERLKDHALFMAFAPVKNPKIAIAVVVENGGHGGSVAAPIAGKVIEAYLNQFSDEDLKAPSKSIPKKNPDKTPSTRKPPHSKVKVKAKPDPDTTAALLTEEHHHG